MKKAIIPDPFKSQNILFVWDFDVPEVNRWLRKRGVEELDLFRDETAGKHIFIPNPVDPTSFILLRRQASRDHMAVTLSHEIDHLTDETMWRTGVPFTRDTKECRAYYKQSIFLDCLAAMREKH